MLNTDSEAKNAACIDEIETLTHELLWLVSTCTDMDALRNVKTHIQSSISVLHAKEKLDKEEKFTPAINPAPNTNHEKQRRFFSTKKKKKRKNLRWAKPSNEEVNKAKKKWQRQMLKYVAYVGKRTIMN